MMPTTREQLIEIAIAQAPSIVAGLKELFARDNPDAPIPTDQEVLDAATDAFVKSLAVDDAWLAAHPNWRG